MHFRTREELLHFLNDNLFYIGGGSVGECYLDAKNKIVYKIFIAYLEENESVYYDMDKFKDLKSSTFIFPKDEILVNGKIVGYTAKYVKSHPLYSYNPLLIKLDSLEEKIKKAKKDVNTLSNNSIRIYDVPYNILYGDSIKIIDTDDYSINRIYNQKALKNINSKAFDLEFYWFLVDNYFNEFVAQDKKLDELYNGKEEDILLFLKLFRKKLSEYTGDEVKKLNSCKKCLNKKKQFIPLYIRKIGL